MPLDGYSNEETRKLDTVSNTWDRIYVKLDHMDRLTRQLIGYVTARREYCRYLNLDGVRKIQVHFTSGVQEIQDLLSTMKPDVELLLQSFSKSKDDNNEETKNLDTVLKVECTKVEPYHKELLRDPNPLTIQLNTVLEEADVCATTYEDLFEVASLINNLIESRLLDIRITCRLQALPTERLHTILVIIVDHVDELNSPDLDVNQFLSDILTTEAQGE